MALKQGHTVKACTRALSIISFFTQHQQQQSFISPQTLCVYTGPKWSCLILIVHVYSYGQSIMNVRWHFGQFYVSRFYSTAWGLHRRIGHFTVSAEWPVLWMTARLEVTLFWYRPLCFCCVNQVVLMLTRCIYMRKAERSVSKQGHLQPGFQS